jgi:uncharacterized membrane protein YdjX (TVP38/TMEM64 family)
MDNSRLTDTIRKYWIPTLVLILLLGGSAYSYINQGIVYSLFTRDIGSVTDALKGYGWLAAFVFCFLVILEVIVAPIPPFVLYIAGGMVFGPLPGGTLALLGNIVGALLAFWIARRYGRGFVERSITPRIRETFDRFSSKYGALSIFLLRLNVFTSSDAFSYLAGLSAMHWRGFALGTVLGLAPVTYLQAYIGHDLLRENQTLFLIFVIVSLVYLILFVYGLVYVRLIGRRAGPAR